MSQRFSILIFAAALSACTEELKAPISGPPAQFAGGHNAPEPRARVTRVESAPSFELEAPPIAEVGNLCTYRLRKEPVMQGYSDRTGAQWEGEIRVRDVPGMDTKWFSPSDKRVATVVARPRAETYRLRIDDNCYNAETKRYYGCTKVIEADLSRVRGFARALTPERANALAIQLCERKVTEVVDKTVAITQENIDTRCHVFQLAYCELPPAPPPPPVPAKKKK